MLVIHDLKKTYSSGKGITGVSMEIPEGTITAVVGPNGAGKSTFFNILNGLIIRQQGTCELDGEDLRKLSLDKTGFLPEADYLIEQFSILQMIDYMMGMKKQKIEEEEIQRLLNGFSLYERRDAKISSLSQGMRKRVSILCAVIGYPALIVLDEPLNALDIQSVIFLKNILKEAKQTGSHILISSHVLDFLDDLTDRVIFFNDGRVIMDCLYEGRKVEQLYREVFHI